MIERVQDISVGHSLKLVVNIFEHLSVHLVAYVYVDWFYRNVSVVHFSSVICPLNLALRFVSIPHIHNLGTKRNRIEAKPIEGYWRCSSGTLETQ